MKILRLQIKDFLGIREADIDLSHPVNLVLGHNGAGKSSVRDAILYALTGRCRSTDAAGRGADSLIRRGASACTVALSWTDHRGAGCVERGRNGSGATGTGKGMANIGDVPADLVEALLDMPHLLRLSAKDRSAILSTVISPAAPLEEIQRHATAAGLSEGAIASLLGGLRRVSPGPYEPAELAEAYKRCYEARREKKRDLAALEAKLQALPPAPVGADAGAIRKSIADLEAEEASLRERLGSLRQQQVEWNRALARRQDLERQAGELAARVRQPQQALPMAPSIEDLTAEVARLREAHRAAATVESGAQEKRVRAESEAKAAWERVVQARDGDASCPAHITDDPCPMLLPRVQERKAQVPDLQKAAKQTDTAANKARTAEKAAAVEAEKALRALEQKESELVAAREAAARHQGSAEASLDAIQAELDRIDEQFPTSANPAAQLVREEQALHELAARKDQAQGRLREIDAAGRSAEERKQLEADGAALRSAASILEELVPVLEPRGLPARLLAEKVGPFEQAVNAQLATITGGEYRVAVRCERGIDLDVFRGGSDLALPPENLSMSERLRLGVALAQAVSVLSGLRILIIDEAEMLDPGNRGLLMRGVQAMVGQIETTIILATAERPTTVMTEQLGVFWAGDGTVLPPVMETEPAGVA